jgi:hypothetical protein
MTADDHAKRTALQNHDKSKQSASLTPRYWESAMKHESNREFFAKRSLTSDRFRERSSIATSASGQKRRFEHRLVTSGLPQ